MKQLQSADFRVLFAKERKEPVEVTSYGKPIGYWYPVGTQPAEGPVVVAEPEPSPEPRMTIRPAKGPRPVMDTTEKRLLDPMDMRQRERERYSELQARLYGPKKKPAVE